MKTKATKRKAWPRIRQVKHKNGTIAWLVDARIGGKGERLFFPTKREAETKANLLTIAKVNGGTNSLDIPDKLRIEAMECAVRLAPFGVTLSDVTSYYIARARPGGGQKRVAEVVAEFLRVKKAAGLKESYLSIQGYVLSNVFGATFGERLIHEIASAELDDWLQRGAWTLRTRLNYYRDIRNLFGFAIGKRYCTENPVDGIQKPKPPAKAPGLLTPKEAGALLIAPETIRLGMQASVAIGLFCGVRSSELRQLDWRNVSLSMGTVAVSAESAKMAERRVIEISDNLRAWLEPLAKDKGRVAPEKTFAWRLDQCRISAAIEDWPKNAMRHSFASYHLAEHKNSALTADMLGHFGDSRTLVNSYRHVVTPKDAAAFWALRPS